MGGLTVCQWCGAHETLYESADEDSSCMIDEEGKLESVWRGRVRNEETLPMLGATASGI